MITQPFRCIIDIRLLGIKIIHQNLLNVITLGHTKSDKINILFLFTTKLGFGI
jgi:hypothetical protein